LAATFEVSIVTTQLLCDRDAAWASRIHEELESPLHPAAMKETAFTSGSLRVSSYARPGKLFTASSDLMTAQVGALTTEALTQIVDAVVLLLRSGTPSPPTS
jgi:hypothetical protein